MIKRTTANEVVNVNRLPPKWRGNFAVVVYEKEMPHKHAISPLDGTQLTGFRENPPGTLS